MYTFVYSEGQGWYQC